MNASRGEYLCRLRKEIADKAGGWEKLSQLLSLTGADVRSGADFLSGMVYGGFYSGAISFDEKREYLEAINMLMCEGYDLIEKEIEKHYRKEASRREGTWKEPDSPARRRKAR